MNNRVLVAAASLVLFFCGGAMAADFPEADSVVDTSAIDALPFYGSFHLGVALPGVVRIDGSVASNGLPAFTGTLNIDPGPAAGAAFGVRFNQHLRSEIALGVAHNAVSGFDFQFDGGGAATGTATGSVTTASLFAVGYYDITAFDRFVPYVSAGLGAVNLTANNIVVAADPDGTTTGNSTVLAGRIGAGFNYKLSESFSIGVDYFAMKGGRSTFAFSDPVGAPALGIAPFTRTITADTMGHALSIGIDGSF